MTTPLTDDQILTLINTVEPIEDWERLIPGALDNPGRYPDADWLGAHFGVMLDNLTSRAVAAAIYAGQNTPPQIREHWAHGKRRYGCKGNHISAAAMGAGLIKWNDRRISRSGRVTRSTATVLERLDRCVGARFGYDDEDLFGWGQGEIITIDPPTTPEMRAADLYDGVLPTDAEIIVLRDDFKYRRYGEDPPSFELQTIRCLEPRIQREILNSLEVTV